MRAAQLSKKGDLMWDRGEYSEALPLYEEALIVCRQAVGENDPNTGMVLGNLARCHTTLGDISKALPLYERAVGVFEKNPGPKSANLALALNNIGSCYYLLGDAEKAIPVLERSLKIREKAFGSLHPETLEALSNIAYCHWSVGEYSKALKMFERVLAAREARLGAHNLTTSDSLVGVADCYFGLGMYEKALPYYQRALDSRQEALGARHPVISASLQNVANCYAELGNYAEAISFAKRALRIQEDSLGVENPITVGCIDDLAIMSYRSGDLDGARLYADRAVEAKQRQLQPILKLDEKTRLSWQQKNLSYWCASILSADAIAQLSLQWKGVVLDSLTEDRAFAVAAHGNTDAAHKLGKINTYRSKLSKIVFDESQKDEVTRLENDIAKRQRELISTLYGGDRKRFAFDIEMKAILPTFADGSTLVDLLQFNDPKFKGDEAICYGVIITGADGAPSFVRIDGGASIDRAIDALRGAISQGEPAEVEERTKFLSEKLWQPVAAKLPKETKRLFVSPDAKLNFLSFGTLIESDGRFVAEKYPVTYVGSGRDLARKPSGEAAKNLVVFADPTFNPSGKTSAAEKMVAMRSAEADVFGTINLPPLPGTKAEAEQLEVIAAGAGWDIKTNTGEEATESSVREVKKPGVLHLATHGFYLNSFSPPAEEGTRGMSVVGLNSQEDKKQNENGVDPMRASGVALTGAQQTLKLWSQRKAPDPETDGVLTAEEVASLNLDGTWLVTLSACETGVGEARSGEGVFGLRRAFMMAGAENLLMTLWPVADDTTASIMADFYKEALATGDAPGSLAKVQRNWLVKLRQEKSLAAAIREAGPFAMVMMTAPTHPPVELPAPSSGKSSWWPF